MSVMNKNDPLIKLHQGANEYMQTDYEDNCGTQISFTKNAENLAR